MAASPIWEDHQHQHQHQQSQPDYDDDVPLSFFSPSFLMADDVEAPYSNMTGNVRRSHTVTATGSRLHRITGSGGGSNNLPPDNSKQLSASTGVSRRTSMKATPGLNRVVENSNSGGEGEEDQQQYPSNAYDDDENNLDLDNQALYSIGSTSSLARHSSMPVSRAFRRDRQLAGSSSNPGAPWQRVNSIKGHSSSSTTSEEQTAHLRRNSTAAESRLSGSMDTTSPTGSQLLHSPNAPSSPINSGFVVTSRPNSASQQLGGVQASLPRFNNAGGQGQQLPSSTLMRQNSASAAPGHGRSLSSHGWSSTTGTDGGTSSLYPSSSLHGHNGHIASSSSSSAHSPTHSRHASETMATSSSNLTAATSLSSASSNAGAGAGAGAGSGAPLYKQAQLARAASNASSTNGTGVAAGGGGGPRSHHSNSDSSPASPIDGSILGHNNPWSPTAQERLHFRELSVSLNPSTLTADQQEILQQLQQPSASSVSPSPPGTSGATTTLARSSAYTDHSSPRRATSLNYHGMGQRNNTAAAMARDHSPGAGANASDSNFRQPQRRNTPLLPPLVTSSEALYNAVVDTDQHGTPAQAANTIGYTGHTVPHQQVQPAAQAWHQQQQQQQVNHMNGTGGNNGGLSSKIIRGPASAAAYVPPIGHTHASDAFRAGANMSPEQAAALHQLVGEGNPHHQHFSPQQHYRHAPQRPPGTQFQSIPNHFRAFTTAAPGVPETSYLSEKDRIAGGGGGSTGQVNPQSQSGNQFVSPLSPSSIIFPQTAGGSSGLNSAITMQFPSLNGDGVSGHNGNVTVDATTAVAFSNNLHLQQQLLAAQTHQLQEQQAQLAAALAAGLSLQDRSAPMHHSQHRQQSSISSLPTSPPPPHLISGNTGMAAAADDPYAIAAKIEALQRANALLVGSMQGQQGSMQQQSIPSQYQQQQHQLQQNQHQHQFQQAAPLFAPFSPMMSQHVTDHSNGITAPTQSLPNGVSPVDIPALIAAKGYNPREFDTQPTQARFFVIKSFTEDDVFKSIKFEIWSSTVLGNNRLDKAFSESANKGPIYLFFSVNASGHFCGIAEMLTPLDYSVTSNVWAQGDKWKGVMKLRWIYIKDIPNPALRHLKLTNTNEQKPVTSSRDTQEVPYDQGCEMLRIFCAHQAKTSLLQDFAYYQARTADPAQPTTAVAAQPKPNSSYSNYDATQGQSNKNVVGHPGQSMNQHPNPTGDNQRGFRSGTPSQYQQGRNRGPVQVKR